MAELTLRTCKDCGVEKPLTEFYIKNGRGRTAHPRYSTDCRSCHYLKSRAWQTRPDNVARVLEYKRKWYHRVGKIASREKHYRKFNSTYAAYDLQLHVQNGKCAICLREIQGDEDRFAFDHDHANGLTRGVLCPACNGGLGSFRDRIDLLRAAIAYLEQWREQHDGAVKAGNGI